MVDVGGYWLAADVTGDAGPTVVFVAAFGEPRSSWDRVLPLLAEPARVVSYDRAGIGQSDGRPDPAMPRPYSALAEELDRLLSGLGVVEPYTLVGHSFGCLIARTYAVRWPGRVAGLVLVDGSVRELVLRPEPDEGFDIDGDRPDATHLDLVAGPAEVTPLSLAVPAVVLTKTPGQWGRYPVTAEIDAHWQRTQRDVADELDAVQIIARDAGHRLNDETPDLVALAVDAVVQALAARRRVELDPARVDAAGGRITRAASVL
jgi:pimeloyl-ACP methyl ester carboxylesterase